MPAATKGKIMNWLYEAGIQARNAAPVPLAYVGEHVGAFTLDGTIKWLGAGYLLLQIAYLAWKWRKEAKHGRK